MKTFQNTFLKVSAILALSSVAQSPRAQAYSGAQPLDYSSITLISGRPDFRLPFVQNIIADGYSFVRFAEGNLTTQQLSILSDRFINRVSMAEIVDHGGSTNFELINRAISFGASRSPVITFNLGSSPDLNNRLCMMMSQYRNHAFVIATQKGAFPIDSRIEGACMARNILRVTGLNADQSDLDSLSAYGDTVRIAAPSVNIPTIGWGGVYSSLRGSTPATMIVAAELAHHAQMLPEYRGADLITSFLDQRTIVLESLLGKVEEGRALLEITPLKK